MGLLLNLGLSARLPSDKRSKPNLTSAAPGLWALLRSQRGETKPIYRSSPIACTLAACGKNGSYVVHKCRGTACRARLLGLPQQVGVSNGPDKKPYSHRGLLGAISIAVLLLSTPVLPAAVPGQADVLATTGLGGVAISPDGSQVAYVVTPRDSGGTSQGSTIRLVASGGKSDRELTAGSAPAWSPDGKTIAYLSSTSGTGNGSRQIWLIPSIGGSTEQLTRHGGFIDRFQWSPDSRSIAFLARPMHARNLRFFTPAPDNDAPVVVDINNLPMNRLFVADLATKKETAITPGTYSAGGYEQWFPDGFHWSPDSRRITFSKRPHAKAGGHLFGDVATVGSDGSGLRMLVEREGMDGFPRWSPDGRHIAFISTERYDWVTVSFLYLVNVETGETVNVTPEFDEKIKQFYWTADGKQILYIAGDRVATQIFAVDVAARRVRALTSGHDVHAGLSVSRDGKSIAFLRQNATTAPDVYVTTLADMRSKRLTPKRLTEVNPQIKEWPEIDTEIIRWPSFDGMEIEGIVHKPLGYRAGKRYPLLVVPHGGPHSVMSNTFVTGDYRLFAQRGWVVFRPNFRGSGHYGEKFLRANLRSWGIGDYEDLMSGVDHLIERGLADPDRMGISGSSYGGYMSSWTISQTDRFKAAVIGAPVTDLPSFVRTTDVPERFESYLGKDHRRYYRGSPMYFGDKIKTPALVWHGDADIRVPLMQGRHLYTALLRNKVPAEFVIYPGEPHGLQKAANRRDLLERKLRWLTKWVLGQ